MSNCRYAACTLEAHVVIYDYMIDSYECGSNAAACKSRQSGAAFVSQVRQLRLSERIAGMLRAIISALWHHPIHRSSPKCYDVCASLRLSDPPLYTTSQLSLAELWRQARRTAARVTRAPPICFITTMQALTARCSLSCLAAMPADCSFPVGKSNCIRVLSHAMRLTLKRRRAQLHST